MARLASSLAWLAVTATAAAAQEQPGRTVVIALEGLGHQLVSELLAQGELPNLARLAEAGTFSPLQPIAPLEGPAVWAAINSGRNPAGTGVAGFVRRELLDSVGPFPHKGSSEDGVPIPIAELADAPEDRAGLPKSFPVVVNTNSAEPFWEAAARQGVASVVLGTHQAWGRPDVANARVLHRTGIPNAAGEYTDFTLYTTDPSHGPREITERAAGTGSGGLHLRVDFRDDWIEARVFGPLDFHAREVLEREQRRLERRMGRSYKQDSETRERLEELEADLKALETPTSLPLTVQVLGPGHCALTLGDETQELFEGEWSDWYRLTFELSGELDVHAVTRAKLLSLDDPHFELYLDAIEIDPSRPPFWQPVSQPADFVQELAEEFGTFSTVGWSYLTHPFKDGLIGPVPFLEDAEHTLRQREAMALELMARDDWQLFVTQLAAADRVQHMLASYADPAHPMHDPEAAAVEVSFLGEELPLSEVIPAVVRELDRFVGRVQDEILRPGDTLLVFSDFGVPGFRRQVHVNNWLLDAGYLVAKEGSSGFHYRLVHTYVDWERTRAYSMGLGSVYLNLAGREPNGIVPPAEADELLRELGAAFLALRDPEHLEAEVALEFTLPGEVHAGPHLDLEADLILGFAPGYRCSWSTAAGGLVGAFVEGQGFRLAPIIEDNDRPWSADHVSLAPSANRGVLFTNRKLALEGIPGHLHIAPTLLSLLGVEPPEEMDVAPLELTD